MRRRTTIATACCALACAAPAGAATNGRIAFTSFRDDGVARIHTMAPDGSDQRPISSGPDAQAEFSPDGSAIAFRRGTPGAYEVWTMGAGGESPQALTDTQGSSNSTQPSWLPDGSGLLFRRGAGGETDIWRMAADGSGETAVVTAPEDQWYPSASPATGRILFATTVTSADRKIQDAAPDGGDVRTLRDVEGSYDSAPAFSPDGRRIAFESDEDGDMEIYVMDADGRGVLQVTRNADHDEGPSWSPDGTRIAFTRGPDNSGGDIWTMAADGSDQRQLTTATARDESPDWQPLPEPATPAGGTPAPAPAAAPPAASGAVGVAPATASGVSLRLAGRRPRLRTALRRGLRLRVTMPEAGRVALSAMLAPAAARRHRVGRRIARRTRSLRAGSTIVRLRPSRRAAARLRGARRIRLRIAAATPSGARSLSLTLRR